MKRLSPEEQKKQDAAIAAFQKTQSKLDRTEREKLRDMSLKEKIAYIITYYKFYFFAAIAVILIIWLIVFMITEMNKENIGQGMAVNASFGSNIAEEIPRDFAEFLGKDPDKVKMVMESDVSYSKDAENTEYGMGFTMKVTTYVAAHTLDFLISDTAGLRMNILQDGGLMDLEANLPEDIKEVVQDDFLYLDNGDGTKTAVGINIKGSPFAEKYQMLSSDLYFVIVSNTERFDTVCQFLRFMYDLPAA